MFKKYADHSKKSQKGNLGRYEIYHASILDPNYISKAKRFKQYYDVIDWQFAIHFSWRQDTVKQILNVLDKLSNTGTRLLISCANGIELKSMLKEKNSIRFQKGVDNYMKFQYRDEDTYTFYMEDNVTEPMVEYYVNDNDLISNLETIGFKLYDMNTFENYKEANKYLFESNIYKLEDQESTSKFYNNYAEAILNNRDIYNQISEYHKLILYFVFIKE
jgi:hypothetical protein